MSQGIAAGPLQRYFSTLAVILLRPTFPWIEQTVAKYCLNSQTNVALKKILVCVSMWECSQTEKTKAKNHSSQKSAGMSPSVLEKAISSDRHSDNGYRTRQSFLGRFSVLTGESQHVPSWAGGTALGRVIGMVCRVSAHLFPLTSSQPLSSSQLTMLTNHCLTKDASPLITWPKVSQRRGLALSLWGLHAGPRGCSGRREALSSPQPLCAGDMIHTAGKMVGSMLPVQGGGSPVLPVGTNRLSLPQYTVGTQLSFQS